MKSFLIAPIIMLAGTIGCQSKLSSNKNTSELTAIAIDSIADEDGQLSYFDFAVLKLQCAEGEVCKSAPDSLNVHEVQLTEHNNFEALNEKLKQHMLVIGDKITVDLLLVRMSHDEQGNLLEAQQESGSVIYKTSDNKTSIGYHGFVYTVHKTTQDAFEVPIILKHGEPGEMYTPFQTIGEDDVTNARIVPSIAPQTEGDETSQENSQDEQPDTSLTEEPAVDNSSPEDEALTLPEGLLPIEDRDENEAPVIIR